MLRSMTVFAAITLGAMLTTAATSALAASSSTSHSAASAASASEGARGTEASGQHDNAYDWQHNNVCQYDTQYFRVDSQMRRHPC